MNVERSGVIAERDRVPVRRHQIDHHLVTRPQVTASNLKLRAPLSGWDSDFWALQDWYRES